MTLVPGLGQDGEKTPTSVSASQAGSLLLLFGLSHKFPEVTPGVSWVSGSRVSWELRATYALPPDVLLSFLLRLGTLSPQLIHKTGPPEPLGVNLHSKALGSSEQFHQTLSVLSLGWMWIKSLSGSF